MDLCGQGAAFSHDPVEFLSTTSTVALTCMNTGKDLCIQMRANAAEFMNMYEDMDPFGEGAGYTGQLGISFLSENNPTSGTHTLPVPRTCGDSSVLELFRCVFPRCNASNQKSVNKVRLALLGTKWMTR